MFAKIGIKVTVLVNLLLFIVIAAGGYYIVGQQGKSLEMQLLARGEIEAVVGAMMVGKLLEEAIDNGVFSLQDAFDTDYEEIPGFKPPKYHTKYDFYLDKAILALEDEFLEDDSVVFAVAVDRMGYLPTHNTRYQQPITGIQERDLIGNRTKRIFNDDVGLAAAENSEGVLKQVYQRDTGVTMWDVSYPIRVKGKHWGGFRIGFSLQKIQAAQMDLRNKLITIMAGILFASLIVVFVAVNSALKPLTHFTKIASDLADGKVNDKIEVTGRDEIAQLADVLERLRISLKAAMDRLRKKA